MKEFKIIYTKNDQPIEEYKMNSFLGSVLIEELYNAEIKDNEETPILYLTLYKDVFDVLYKKQEFKYDTDESLTHIVDGLKYFISDRLGEFILVVKNNMYYEEKKKVEEFFKENINEINLHSIFKNPSIPLEFFIKYLDREKIDWSVLCQNTSIPINFFKENFNEIDWYWLCKNSSIPFEFFKKHIDKIIWKSLCQNTSIPYEFFKENLHKLCEECWRYLCENTSISIEFFKEHVSKIEEYDLWYWICKNPSIPLEFFGEHIDKIDWSALCQNPSVPLEFLKEHIIWGSLCRNPSIPIEFFEKHIKKIEWSFFCKNYPIPIEFLEKYFEKIRWSSLCQNPNISLEFFKEYKKKIKWAYLSQNPSIPLEFFKERLNKVDWSFLCSNPFNIKKKIEQHLGSIDPILNDKYIQTSFIVSYCLQLLNDNKNIEHIKKLCVNEYPLISNTIEEKGDAFYSQIKHFLCTLKEGNEYKNELKQLCEGKEKKEKEEKKEEGLFIIDTYDMKNPIRTVNNYDIIKIIGPDRIINLIKENDIFHDIESLDYYDMNDIFKFQGSKAYVIKGKISEKQDLEEKQKMTKDIEDQKNIALHIIHERLREEIPELTFKMFYEAYKNMYSHKNPLTFTEQEFNSLFHKVKRYIDIKKLERDKQLRELQLEVKEEVKEEPIDTNMYNALLLRDGRLTVNEFNRIYRLTVDLFTDEMTFDNRVNLMYNHIDEIRRNI